MTSLRLRSLLFVPGDRPDRMEKALGLGADALILDLEDSIAKSAKADARDNVARLLSMPRDHGVTLLVRVNPVDSEFIGDDLSAVVPAAPDGIVLPKAEGDRSIADLSALCGDHPSIVPLTAETASSLFDMGSFRRCADRLCALTWGAEDLASGIGAMKNRDVGGHFTEPFALARSLVLYTAHACGVPAIETVYPDINDLSGLSSFAAEAAMDGFTGMMAIHPSQVPVINQAFTPSEAQISHARAVIAAFEADPGAGVLKVDGKMVDAPHLKQAHSILSRAD